MQLITHAFDIIHNMSEGRAVRELSCPSSPPVLEREKRKGKGERAKRAKCVVCVAGRKEQAKRCGKGR